MQGLLHLAVRYHFPANLRKTGQPIGDGQESVVVEQGDVPGNVPAFANDARCKVFPSEVAGHDVRAFDEQHTRASRGQWRETIGIDDADRYAWQGLSDGPTTGRRLIISGRAKVGAVYRDYRGTFRDTVSLDRLDAESIFECLIQAQRKFLRAGDDHP